LSASNSLARILLLAAFSFDLMTLTSDITYFFSLIGITEIFTVSAVLFTVELISNISAFPLVEVWLVSALLTTDYWSS
jgi:hypothetical protein